MSAPFLADRADTPTGLVAWNVELLRQAAALLQRLEASQYRRAFDHVAGSSIGSHVRHNLDHYALFLEGISVGCVDYEPRERDGRLEESVNDAVSALRATGVRLRELTPVQLALPLRLKNVDGGIESETSVARELEFLASHTVHHYALVAVLCRLQGVTVGADFGVAPSTLRYRAASAAVRHG